MLNDFKFGLETEYILTNNLTHDVLWYDKIPFHLIYEALEEISLDGIPSLEGLDSEPAHPKILPFVVEGYHLKDKQFKAVDMHPKGVEIRSPICKSIDECIMVQRKLFLRLLDKLKQRDLGICILSHHPWATHYEGEQANRPLHFWKWALKAMMTYGPDINISWNSHHGKNLFENKADFEELLNYYAPALVAFSAFSPIYNNTLAKDEEDNIILSNRTIHRSEVAPLIEWHENENFRLEFKFFDMALSYEELRIYFVFCLILMSSKKLPGRATLEEGKALLKVAAVKGLHSSLLASRLEEILQMAPLALQNLGLPSSSLDLAKKRLQEKKCPADYLIDAINGGQSLKNLLEIISHHYERENDWRNEILAKKQEQYTTKSVYSSLL